MTPLIIIIDMIYAVSFQITFDRRIRIMFLLLAIFFVQNGEAINCTGNNMSFFLIPNDILENVSFSLTHTNT